MGIANAFRPFFPPGTIDRVDSQWDTKILTLSDAWYSIGILLPVYDFNEERSSQHGWFEDRPICQFVLLIYFENDKKVE